MFTYGIVTTNVVNTMYSSAQQIFNSLSDRLIVFARSGHVRADPAIAATPIVFLTSRGQLQDLELGKLAGANAYLTKPFSPLQLIETVEAILSAAS